jgi:hypothetical protein
MNTANLQLEGLYAVLAALMRSLQAKDILSAEEMELALDEAEQSIAADTYRKGALSAANLDAVRFPIRLLRIASRTPPGQPMSFTELATAVGETKPDH